VKAITNALAASIDGNLPGEFFVDILRRGFSEDEGRHQLDIAIDWGRYGELFDYDADSGELVLSEVAAALTPHLS
jgi:NitT/TauT family transport system ATP-binding protein